MTAYTPTTHRFDRPSRRSWLPALRRSSIAAVTAGIILASSTFGVMADGGGFSGGGKLAPADSGYGSTDVSFKYSSYATEYDDSVYQYASGDDGTAYYTTYDGQEWSGWTSWDAQPTKFSYDPAPATYEDDSYVYYTGDDGAIYQYDWNAEAWTPLASDYTFKSAPAVAVNEVVSVSAYADDGNVYYNSYDGSAWSGWVPVSDTASYGKAGADPYAVAWGGYENIFWTGDDGNVYWNRYDGSTWNGPKALPGDDTFDYGVYAVGYEADQSLYAYGVTSKGAPAYNVFDGDGWSGWTAYDVDWTAKYQPNAYVYDDVQHVVYTGADGHGYHITYDGKAWGSWDDLGANYDYDSSQYEYDGDLYLTYTGEDGSVYYKTWEPEKKGY
jgi:hypothetical protein